MTTSKREVVPSVQMPSADLINFRFDQTDKQFEELKLALSKLTTHYLTKDEAYALREERDAKIAEIETQLANFRWYWRAVVGAVLVALCTAAASFIVKA